MRHEAVFKLAFIAAFLTAAAIAATTAKRASAIHGGGINQLHNEVRSLIVIRSILGLVFYASLVAWFMDWGRQWTDLGLPLAVRYVAIALFGVVLTCFAWSFRSIGNNYRGALGLYDNHQLVTSGAYSRVRHPIYLSFILLMCCVTLLSANWVLGLSGLSLVIVIPLIRVREEERQLHERFADRWEKYRRRTGAFVPRWS